MHKAAFANGVGTEHNGNGALQPITVSQSGCTFIDSREQSYSSGLYLSCMEGLGGPGV
jgi:hypothetical protein